MKHLKFECIHVIYTQNSSDSCLFHVHYSNGNVYDEWITKTYQGKDKVNRLFRAINNHSCTLIVSCVDDWYTFISYTIIPIKVKENACVVSARLHFEASVEYKDGFVRRNGAKVSVRKIILNRCRNLGDMLRCRGHGAFFDLPHAS